MYNYNQFTKGDYLLDQYINYYMFPNKAFKWYFRIVLFMLEVASVNSYVIYKESRIQLSKKVVSFFNFRRSIAKGLLSEWLVSKKIVSTPQKTVPKPLEAQAMSLWGECHLDKQT